MGAPRRLPGYRFEAQPPPITDVLPRMDIAVFVGFAATGPLHLPVVVEDAARFTAVFGDDAPLAWDAQRSEPVYAYLAPAVRAFFRNGGRRCWVIRVAGEARFSHFPLANLARVLPDGNLAPAFARARSAGSAWDGLRVSASLQARSLALTSASLSDLTVELSLAGDQAVASGDLVRLSFPDSSAVLVFPVLAALQSSAALPTAGALPRRIVRVRGGDGRWCLPLAAVPAGNAQVTLFSRDPHDVPAGLTVPARAGADQEQGGIVLELTLGFADAPAPGSLLRVDWPADQAWLAVDTVGITGEAPDGEVTVRVRGPAWRVQRQPPSPLPAAPPIVEQLLLDLWARTGDGQPVGRTGLGLAAGHPANWDALPTDDDWYAAGQQPGDTASQATTDAAPGAPFPLAGSGLGDAWFLPLGLPAAPAIFSGPALAVGSALERAGLGNFAPALFLDPALAASGAASLLAEADYVRYQAPEARALRGIHAALAVEEATLIAVPDAVQRGWTRHASLPALPPEAPGQPVAGTAEAFRGCDDRTVPPPVLTLATEPDASGTFTLAWTAASAAALTYTLQEATSADFGDAVAREVGSVTRLTIYGRSHDDYYYRLRVAVDGVLSAWSAGIQVSVAAAGRWYLRTPAGFSADTLLTVQRALLQLCRARGDLLAVLAAPEHYREGDLGVLTTRLTGVSAGGPAVQASASGTKSSTPAGSFGALYHPWLIGREENRPAELRRVPPDGALCGLLAERALARGAWLAPGNQALSGVLALSPDLGSGIPAALADAPVNLVTRGPRGFAPRTADTLSDDASLRPLNVRRLLILLRRLALRLGTGYVFEPNDDAFGRLVQRGFEDVLDLLYARGAFAGASAEQAYQVVTDGSLNPLQSRDAGRFIVELRVAPSRPLTFLTVRLVQLDDRSLVTEGG